MKPGSCWIALLPLLLSFAACNRVTSTPAGTSAQGSPARAGTHAQVMDQRLATLAVGQQGFKCEGSDTYRACTCMEKASDIDSYTCKGMAKMCRDTGAGSPTCKDGVCSCEVHF